jgi:hypothetical protein
MGSDSDTSSQKSGKGADEVQASKKRSKKDKGKHKNKSQNKAKLKKEARELRLASLSEGLEDFAFSGLRKNAEGDIETEGNEMQKALNVSHQFLNGDNIKKNKRFKRKLDETEHNNTVTNKKIR